ncbi:integrase [Kibdelosporangium banguiense]|uniref:Integrase n=1 Tax=Kibdelosporangium banguiense TaxID=1365924 RepID=A0ABS4TD95_9PSEU|nr:integrase [Kibdelosporangium banguiense]MBP2322397.1 integrase [Kibdelosporangium banguiense]
MTSTYNVRVWSIQTRYKAQPDGSRKPTRYVVRWMVGRERFDESFKIRTQADGFRSTLMSAAKDGQPFDVTKGLPLAMLRTTDTMSWFDFACAYVDLKWNDIAPKSRKSAADSLVSITRALIPDQNGRPDHTTTTRALRTAFNKNRRDQQHPEEISRAIRWLRNNTPTVGVLADAAELRALLTALDRNRNGQRAAVDTVRLRRTTLRNSLDYAVERKLLDRNPIGDVKARKQKSVLHEVDRRSVANPVQARTLLSAVRDIHPQLVAFFAVMYFAALRPEEAVNLRKHNLSLPEEGWGELHLERAAPEVGEEWTDSRTRGEQRSLKHREDGKGRPVPCSDELTAILHDHIAAFGTAPDGRLFRAVRGDGWLSSSVYGRTWAKARAAAFTPEVVVSPLAKRPYDLRHAAVSTWLNATGDPTRVAEWAGHSVAVLLRVYAKCLDGGEQEARQRVQRWLNGL